MNALVTAGRPNVVESAPDMGGQCLTFLLRGSVYAIALAQVREIIEFGPLTTVPRMPEFVRGVMNLRGAVLPVIDLGARLGLAGIEPSRKTCVVILEVAETSPALVIGAMVDAVSEVIDVPSADIQRAPEFGATIDERFVRGMVRTEDRFMILLDATTALSFKEMAKLAETMDQP